MASGLEIIPLISGSIDIIKVIQGLYGAIKSYEGLPKAFEGVNKHLSLVQHALKLAQERERYLDDETRASVKGILQQCEKNIQRLHGIFKALKDAEGKSVKDVYTRAVIHIGKRGRVEDLMKDTLSNINRLAAHQQFLLTNQIQELQSAIESLANMPPSIPDAELERKVGGSDIRQTGHHNTQNTNFGDGYNTSGGTVYTAGNGAFTQNYHYGSEETPWRKVARWLQPQAQNDPKRPNPITSNDIKRDKYQLEGREEAGQWLLEGPSFQDWVKPESSTKVLWLYGDAGYGKSVLCMRAILFIEQSFKRHIQAPHYFYDGGDEPEGPTTVYRSLACSLFRQKYKPEDEISDRIYEFADAQGSMDKIKKFIKVIVEELETAYIFLDGLDEVLHHRNRRQYAIDTLQFCLSLTNQQNADVKVWCSSQDRDVIRQTLGQFQHSILPLTEKENATDIVNFMCHAGTRILRDDGDGKKWEYFTRILQAIKGNFLWAALVIESMERVCMASDLDKLVQELPSSFEEYLKNRIRCIDPDSYKVFSQVLSCLVYAKRPISFEELREAIGSTLYATELKDQCSPFIRIEQVAKGTMTQSICSIYHTTLRVFLSNNPHILQSEDQHNYRASEDLSISPRMLANATLRCLQQERYLRLLRPQNTGASSPFMTEDSSAGSSGIIDQHLLIYSAKNWAKHVDELYRWYEDVSPASVDTLWEDVHQFVRSKNFGTCLQIQSLFVQARFSDWYLDGECFRQGEGEDRNKTPYFMNSLPRCYTRCGDGASIDKQYQEAMMEWAYFLRSESTIHGKFPGEIAKCQWPSLGKSNFMHQIESRLRSYRLENDGEGNISASDMPSYFLGCGSDARGLQVMSLKVSQVQDSVDKAQLHVQSWTARKLGRQHKSRDKAQLVDVTSDDLRLYAQPLELRDHEVGRAARVTIAGDGALLRIGPKIYIRNGRGDFEPLNLGYSQTGYVEEACRSGPWVAIVQRRGVQLANQRDDHHKASQNARYDQEESDSDSSSDSSEEDPPNEEEQAGMQFEVDLASDDLGGGWNSDLPNTASEFSSDGSTTEATDDLLDDNFDDLLFEDEHMDVDESSDEFMDTSSAAESTTSHGTDDETDPEDDASSDISLRSSISRQMWGDDSGSERSDDEPEPFTMDETSEERFSDRRQLVIFSLDPSTNQARRVFRFVHRWVGKLFNSPPVIHPAHGLAVWPLGRNKILFANLTGSPKATYFTRSLRTGARNICHISIQARFSDCGQFLHVACLEGRQGSNSKQPRDRHAKTAAAPDKISQLYLCVFTYRLSKAKPARSPPRLVYKAAVLLDNKQLLKDGEGRLLASPLPYTITWTVDHVYATQSHRILRVYRLPLYHGVEERDFGQDVQQQDSDEKGNASDSDFDMDLDEPKPTPVAFGNDKSIFLPNSASRRSVFFFPAPDEATRTGKVGEKGKGKAKRSSKPHKKRSEGEKVVATVVISPEDSLINKEQRPYIGPPQVLYLTADEFGSWTRLSEDDCGAGEGKGCAEAWSGGQLERLEERFDNEEDCDIVPYFR